jgi:hypothetical protein
MSNEGFQIIITLAVVLAYLSAIVQGLVAFALYRDGRRMAARLSPVIARTKAIFGGERDSLRGMEVVIDKILLCGDILERLVPKVGSVVARLNALRARAAQLKGPVEELERNVKVVETSTHFMSLEIRPQLVSIRDETSGLARSAVAQARRLGRVVRDAIAHFTHLRENVLVK